MPQTELQIIPSVKQEALKRKRLLTVIQKKRAVLAQWVVKTEMLRINTEMARQEYMVKVGNLFLKDSHLDLEIIRFRNILKLMQDGLSYDEANEKISGTYYAQQIEFERERKRAQEEEEIFQKRESHAAHLTENIKQIWKKLIARFHPDLVQDADEKDKRDKIMKLINRAYQEGDYDQLVNIEKEHIEEQETSIDNLEEILARIMNEIIQQIELYAELKKSEWYDWMIKIEKAKKQHVNIFAETEKKLLNDIVAKIEVINTLRTQIQQKETRQIF